MRSASVVAMGILLLLGPAYGADDAVGAPVKPRPTFAVWDTGRPSATALPPAALAGKNEWTVVPAGKTAPSFQGDAVLSNGRMLVVARKQDAALEVHAAGPDGVVSRARLRLLAPTGAPAARLARLALVENSKSALGLEAAYQTGQGAELTARFRLKRGDIALQVEPGAGAGRLRVECPGRFVALPDFFADDIVIDARKIPSPAAEVPSENFLLHLTGKGDGIVMCVFENRQQDAKITLAGEGDQRAVTGSELGFEGKKVWVSLLDGPGMWHTVDVKSEDTGRVMPLEWKMPFPAEWRVDFTRADGLSDSWDMLLQEKEGGPYVKASWLGGGAKHLVPDSPEVVAIDRGTFGFGTGGLQVGADRRRWSTVLGTYHYPCWSDPAGHGYIQPLKSKAVQFRGPVVVYPISRVPTTPPNSYTVVDVVRNTLGVGPCEYILDLEGQKHEYKGRATCAVRNNLTDIYGKHQQKQRRAEVEQTIDDGLAFVQHIRDRITRYVEFGHRMRAYLAEQKKAHPELAEPLTELEKLVGEIDARVAARAAKIKTPADVARMNGEFRKTVLDDDGPDALARCKQYAEALVEIGGNQDELAGECRWVVKNLRQQAGLRMALDPRLARIAEDIRAKTQEALRNPAVHEGARH